MILSLHACFFSKYNTEIGNFPPDSAVPDMKLTPLPLSAALVIPDSVSGAVYEGWSYCPIPPWMFASVEIAYGKELERLAIQAFAQVFEKVDLVDEKAKAVGRYDGVIEPNLNIDIDGRCIMQAVFMPFAHGLLSNVSSLEFSLQTKVTDAGGSTVLFSEGTKGDYCGSDCGFFDSGGVSSKISYTLEEAGRRMISTPRLLQYAQSLPGTTEERMAQRRQGVMTANIVPDTSIPIPTDEKLPPLRKDAYALVIGIDYKQRQDIPHLQYASQDAKKVYDILTDPRYGGIPKENTILLLNEKATRIEIMKAVRKIKNLDGYVYLYYSGHGAPKTRGDRFEEGLLVPNDVDISDPEAMDESSVRMSYLEEMLGSSQAKGVMIALDACFTGEGRSIVPKGGKPMAVMLESTGLIRPKGANRIVITSSLANQQSWEDEKEIQGGIFSHYLLEGLKGRGGQDAWVKAGELAEYIKANVPKATKKLKGVDQNPQVFGQADFAVSRNWERSKVLDIEMASSKLKTAFEKGAINSEQLNRAMDELKTQNRSKTLELFLEGKIDEAKFGKLY